MEGGITNSFIWDTYLQQSTHTNTEMSLPTVATVAEAEESKDLPQLPQ